MVAKSPTRSLMLHVGVAINAYGGEERQGWRRVLLDLLHRPSRLLQLLQLPRVYLVKHRRFSALSLSLPWQQAGECTPFFVYRLIRYIRPTGGHDTLRMWPRLTSPRAQEAMHVAATAGVVYRLPSR